jgi:hypothetical protein
MAEVISVRAEVSESRASMGARAAGDRVGFAGLDGDLLGDVAEGKGDGTSVGWPAASCTGVWLVAKPEASTWTVYLPGARLAKAYLPWESEVHLLRRAGGVAPDSDGRAGQGRTPRGSSTVPVRLAEDCA